jgi:predicted dehydrogenase
MTQNEKCEPRFGEKDNMRVAILGCGRMGRLHIERLTTDGRGTAVALFDSDFATADQLRTDLIPNAQVFTNFEDLIRHASVDAAIIGTPTSLHFEHIRRCRSAGWHVLCEKPLADRREHLLTLIEESRGAGPVLSVAYQRRYWPVYRALQEELRSGRWGAIRAVTSINSERWQQTIGGTWRDDPGINLGGFIGDAGSHKIAFFPDRTEAARCVRTQSKLWQQCRDCDVAVCAVGTRCPRDDALHRTLADISRRHSHSL